MRASDEDRERLISDLNEHMAAGRLDADELEERLQAAYAAKTTAELDALRRDLPVSRRGAQLDHAARRSHLSRRMIQQAGGSAGLFLLCTAIWLADGASGQFWPVWVLIPVLLVCGRTAWALYGPAPDLEAAERHLDRRPDGRRRHLRP
jgi:hypothetical protein